jgi:hypothetical protein
MACRDMPSMLYPSGKSGNTIPRKPVERARLFSSKRPIGPVSERVVIDFERGVSLHSLGILYRTRVDTLQGVLRETMVASRQRIRTLEAAVRRAGLVVAMGLLGLMGIDAWDAAAGCDAVEIQRAFRARRGRRRGLEDGCPEVVEFARADVRCEPLDMLAARPKREKAA